jgi:predicted transcriptional regulator
MGKSRLLFWGFKPPGDLVRSALGTLEQQVLDVVWEVGSASVRDVHARLTPALAYTTVMTTLDRLYRKGLLTRRKEARAFVYAGATSREELQEILASEVLAGLLSNRLTAPHPLLSNFVEAIGDQDRRLLDELERLVKEKRRRLKKPGQP